MMVLEETTHINSLTQAVEDSGHLLRSILKNQSIRLLLVDDQDSAVLKDCKKWKNQEGFHYPTYFSKVGDPDGGYIVALYAKNALLGLCRMIDKSPTKSPDEFCIHTIEGKDGRHLLKGYVVPAFCETALGIAQALGKKISE